MPIVLLALTCLFAFVLSVGTNSITRIIYILQPIVFLPLSMIVFILLGLSQSTQVALIVLVPFYPLFEELVKVFILKRAKESLLVVIAAALLLTIIEIIVKVAVDLQDKSDNLLWDIDNTLTNVATALMHLLTIVSGFYLIRSQRANYTAAFAVMVTIHIIWNLSTLFVLKLQVFEQLFIIGSFILVLLFILMRSLPYSRPPKSDLLS